MSKKLYIGLAPLLAIAAFVLTPAVAQATSPHWFVNGTEAPHGEPVETISWGQLTLESEPAGIALPVICNNVAGGTIENPKNGGPGVAKTANFATYECKDEECPAGLVSGLEKEFNVVSAPQDLPWPATLIGTAPKAKLNSTGVVVELECDGRLAPASGGPAGAYSKRQVQPEGSAYPTGLSPGENELYPLKEPVKCETTATHLQDPEAHNGTNNGPNQSTLIFNQPAGS